MGFVCQQIFLRWKIFVGQFGPEPPLYASFGQNTRPSPSLPRPQSCPLINLIQLPAFICNLNGVYLINILMNEAPKRPTLRTIGRPFLLVPSHPLLYIAERQCMYIFGGMCRWKEHFYLYLRFEGFFFLSVFFFFSFRNADRKFFFKFYFVA